MLRPDRPVLLRKVLTRARRRRRRSSSAPTDSDIRCRGDGDGGGEAAGLVVSLHPVSAERRLLDLLSGWADAADTCAASHAEKPHPGVGPDDYRREAHAVASLYQQAGGHEEMSADDVERFVRERIIPLIRNGPDEPIDGVA